MTTDKLKRPSAKDILIVTLGIIILMLGGCSYRYYSKYNQSVADFYVANDSLTTYKNKYGEEYTAKNTFMMKADRLKQYNDSLYREYQSLKDHPIIITKTKVITKIDTVYAKTDTIMADGEYVTWQWSAKDSTFYKISGSSRIKLDMSDAQTIINDMVLETGLTLDVVDDGKQIKVVAKTNNPYVALTGMQSVMIDPMTSPTISRQFKPKKHGIGPFIGVGVNVSATPQGIQPGVGISLGFGYTKSILQW